MKRTLIICKKDNKVLNILSYIWMLNKLKNNCMHRVTFEPIEEPVIIAERIEELKLTMITNG